jgi:hypothetical protein
MSRGPGKWQRAVLDALEAKPVFFPAARFRVLLGRQLTRPEDVALRRAVRQLERAGLVETALLWWRDKIVLQGTPATLTRAVFAISRSGSGLAQPRCGATLPQPKRGRDVRKFRTSK